LQNCLKRKYKKKLSVVQDYNMEQTSGVMYMQFLDYLTVQGRNAFTISVKGQDILSIQSIWDAHDHNFADEDIQQNRCKEKYFYMKQSSAVLCNF
jgi:hypothetical protein